mmetsp:Transcript_14909/g.16601  ORF Transcript_14909/g.16601 Transcript_14909/m.16601 type:complete len:215 (+) Transcript_14909:15-659(+)|eukprot:CAMPEP_0205832610 /NCGR_PEP_ID=MMETSP0206-20130828/47373_1 /ASSEMBLY_ACC=CAM_ASM_000279 /TAXON_ID=36767 /ORGANISM="Euplotes focardii, Strain TN1" /LENGTH=214 /DNA_ID=CAMNT_0053138285 /DNA_START=8 /DNA_END=652 /DNA_ORIENTATION=+
MNKYWCHSCQKQFEDIFVDNEEPHCEFCQGIFIEEIISNQTEEDHPSHFEPYVTPGATPADSTQRQGTSNSMSFSYNPGRGAQAIHIISSNMARGGANAHGGLVGNLMGMLGNYLDGSGQELFEGGQTFDQILQQIVANDPNKYGPPPASKDSISKLSKGTFHKFYPEDEESKDEKEEKTKEENSTCGVCYDEYNYEDKLELMKLPCKHLYHTE